MDQSNWRISLIFLIISVTGTLCQLDLLEHHVKHLQVCYNNSALFSGNFHYPPQSLDNLLAIIERIERHSYFTSKSPRDVALYILTRFRVDGIVKRAISPSNPEIVWRWDTERNFRNLQDLAFRIATVRQSSSELNNDYIYYPVNFLTDFERCGLHWMVSHSFNLTFRQEEENNVLLTPPPSVVNRKKRQNPVDPNIPYYDRESNFPLEMGVIDTPTGTVAAGSLLVGLVTAYERSTTEVPITSIIHNLPSADELYGKKININFAGLGSIAAAADRGNRPNKYSTVGPKGWWNSTYCPNKFVLQTIPTSATTAQIYGSFDGYFIARRVSTILTGFERIPLSHLLRMYYNNGIFGELRSCNRVKMLKEELDKPLFQENLATLIVLENKLLFGTIAQIGPALIQAGKIIDDIKENYTKGAEAQNQCENEYTGMKIEPMVDLYVVLDTSIRNDFIRLETSSDLIGEIGNLLDISPNTSHMGIYINDAKMFDQIFPMNHTLSEAELKCKLQWLHFGNWYGMKSELWETIRKLKALFTERRIDEEDRGVQSTPAKVVLFALFGQQAGSLTDIKWQMDLFRRDHPEVITLGVGSVPILSEALVKERDDIFAMSTSDHMQLTAKLIRSRLEKSIMPLVYSDVEGHYCSC